MLHQQDGGDSLEMFHSLTKTALQFIKIAHETFGNDSVSLSGHSVGGSVAMICGAITNNKSIAINPVPVDKNIILDCCRSQDLFLENKTEEEIKSSLEQHRKNITVVSVKGELTSQTNLMTPTAPNLNEPHELFCKYELVLRSASTSKSFRKSASQVIGMGVTLLQTLLGSVKLYSFSSNITKIERFLNALQKHTMQAASDAFIEALESQEGTQNLSWLKDHDQPQFTPLSTETPQKKIREKRQKAEQKEVVSYEVRSDPQQPLTDDSSENFIAQTNIEGHKKDVEIEFEDELSNGSVPEDDLSDISDSDEEGDIFATDRDFIQENQDEQGNVQDNPPQERPGFFRSIWNGLFRKK